MKSNFFRRTIATPIGLIIAIAHEDALVCLDFVDDKQDIESSNHHILLKLEKELEEYFAKKREYFTIPLAPDGTPFQKDVWNTLCKIVYGSTVSYSYEAEMLGNPKATRAVANANSKNPISILIPCHRVISASGKIGGYSGGVWRKEFLLSLEKKLSI